MVTVRMSDEAYALVVRMLAQSLEAEMLHGVVQEWDDANNALLRALVEVSGYVSRWAS